MQSLSRFSSLFLILAAAIVAPLFTGCGDDPVEPDPIEARLRFAHMAPDSPTGKDILMDGTREFLNRIFGDVTTYVVVEGGTRNVDLVATGTVDPLGSTTITLEEDSYNSLFVTQDAAGDVKFLKLTDDLTAPEAGKAHVRFVHLIADAPTVKIGVQQKGPIVTDLSFLDNKPDFTDIDPGAITFNVQDNSVGGGGQGGTPPVISKSFGIEEGKIYTFILNGKLSDETADIAMYTH